MDMMNGMDMMDGMEKDGEGWDGEGWGHTLGRPTVQTKTAPSKQSIIKTKNKKEVVLPKGDKQGSGFIIVHSQPTPSTL